MPGAPAHSRPRILHMIDRMGGRAVEGTGLENRQTFTRLEGSNPSPSAIIPTTTLIYLIDYKTVPTIHLTCPQINSCLVGRLSAPCAQRPRTCEILSRHDLPT